MHTSANLIYAMRTFFSGCLEAVADSRQLNISTKAAEMVPTKDAMVANDVVVRTHRSLIVGVSGEVGKDTIGSQMSQGLNCDYAILLANQVTRVRVEISVRTTNYNETFYVVYGGYFV